MLSMSSHAAAFAAVRERFINISLGFGVEIRIKA